MKSARKVRTWDLAGNLDEGRDAIMRRLNNVLRARSPDTLRMQDVADMFIAALRA